MKKIFYFGILLLVIFEILNVYFIMPMPGSQDMNSIGIAYFLYSWRWVFRSIFAMMIIVGFIKSWNTGRKWARILALLPAIAITWLFNFKMVADHMFLQPSQLIMKNGAENSIPLDRLVLGVEFNGESRAYPIEFLAYHHQVRDSIGGKAVIVTYCSVCRTGRVFEPMVNGKSENFRLVGMDHFNAMFEDETTGSWWRQVNGEAIAGDLKGQKLPEVEAWQMSLDQWLLLYPNSLIMQEDPAALTNYDPNAEYEKGLYEGGLTGTDKNSWKNKSWVIGIQSGVDSKAYDWNTLLAERVILDRVGKTPIVLAISEDNQSFVAFERQADQVFNIHNDTLSDGLSQFNLAGHVVGGAKTLRLKPINAYQEFWHSWRTFHPGTLQYE